MKGTFNYKEGHVFYPYYYQCQTRLESIPKFFEAKYIDDEGNEVIERIDKSTRKIVNLDKDFFESGLCKNYGFSKYEFQYNYKKYFIWSSNDLDARDDIVHWLSDYGWRTDIYYKADYSFKTKGIYKWNSFKGDQYFDISQYNPIEIIFEPSRGYNIFRQVDHRLFLTNKPKKGTFDYNLKKTVYTKLGDDGSIPMRDMVNIMAKSINRFKEDREYNRFF